MSIAQLKVLGASVAIAMGLLATGAEVVRAYQAPAGPSGAAQAKAAAAASATPAVPSSAPGGIGSTGPRAERSAAPAVGSGAGMMPGGLGAAPGAGMGPADARLDLAQQQVELARRGLAQVERLIQAGEAGPAELQHWAKRLLDARLALHPTGDESIAALKDYVEQARRWVQVLQNLQKVGQKSNLDVIDAEFDLLNARLELEKRIKPAASGLPGMGMFPPGAAPPAVSAGAGMGMLPPKPEQPEGFKGGGLAPPVTYARVPAQGGVIPPEPTLVVPAGMPEGGVGGGGFGGRGRSAVKFRKPNPLDEPRNKAIEEKLEMVIDLRFKVETPLEDFLGYIKDQTKGKDGKEIPVYVDPKGLQEAECTMTSPVMIELEGVPLRTTLRLVLEQVGLRYEVADGILLITNEQPEE